MKKALTILTILIALTSLSAQTLTEREVMVNDLFNRIAATRDDTVKLETANRLQREMVETIKEADDFYYSFPKTQNIGKIISADEQIHMYSWNVLLNSGATCYYAIFQNREYDTIYTLQSTNPYQPEDTAIYKTQNWYGTLYYEIHPLNYRNEEDAYLILGISFSGNAPYRQKVADIIRFTRDGITFGAPDIENPYGGCNKTRWVFTYYANAIMAVEYDAKRKTLYHDHLSPIRTLPNGKVMYGPDMSVDAYAFRRDIWKCRTDVHVKNAPEEKKKK